MSKEKPKVPVPAPTVRKPVRRSKGKENPAPACNKITTYLRKVVPKEGNRVLTPKRKRVRRSSEEGSEEEENQELSVTNEKAGRKVEIEKDFNPKASILRQVSSARNYRYEKGGGCDGGR